MNISPKHCRECGDVFEPTSGAQKWCLPCRSLRSSKLPDDERPAALARQAERKTLYGQTPERELLLAEQDLLHQRLVALGTMEARLEAVPHPDAAANSVVREAARALRQRRQEFVDRQREYILESENAVRWAHLCMSYEHARQGIGEPPPLIMADSDFA